MIDFISLIFEFFSSENIAHAAPFFENTKGLATFTPVIFFKAEKAPYDSDAPPRQREEWENILAARPVDLIVGNIPRGYTAIPRPSESGRSAGIERANAILQSYNPQSVHDAALNLNHHDTAQIIKWGSVAEQALSDFLTENVQAARKRGMNAAEQSENALKDFEAMVLQPETGKLRKAAIKARLGFKVYPYYPAPRKREQLEFKIAPWDKKMDVNLASMKSLEDHYTADIGQALGRVEHYKVINEQLEKIDQLLRVYKDALQERRGDIIRGEARALQARGADDQSLSLRAFGGQKRGDIRGDIDARLEALENSMRIAEAGYLAFANMQEREVAIIQSMELFKQKQLPLFRQQLLQALDIKLGRVAAFNTAANGTVNGLLSSWRKKDPAQEIFGSIGRALKNEQQTRKAEQRAAQQEIQKSETLLIEDMRPVALLEGPAKERIPVAALPPPSQFEREL